MGGSARVGLEDLPWEGPAKLTTSKAVPVRRIRSVLEGLSMEIATPGEARVALKLKGRAAMEIPV